MRKLIIILLLLLCSAASCYLVFAAELAESAETENAPLSWGLLEPIDISGFELDENLNILDIYELSDGDMVVRWSPGIPFKIIRIFGDNVITKTTSYLGSLHRYDIEQAKSWTGLYEIKGIFSSRDIFNETDAVRALAGVRSLMGIEDLSYACVEIRDESDFQVFHFQQLYKDVRVFQGKFEVGARYTGEPYFICGKYEPNIQVDINPKITAEEAEQKVELGKYEEILETNLEIFIDTKNTELKETGHLCWKVTMGWGNEVEAYYFIDAETGKRINITWEVDVD